jgi:hypothetical protein
LNSERCAAFLQFRNVRNSSSVSHDGVIFLRTNVDQCSRGWCHHRQGLWRPERSSNVALSSRVRCAAVSAAMVGSMGRSPLEKPSRRFVNVMKWALGTLPGETTVSSGRYLDPSDVPNCSTGTMQSSQQRCDKKQQQVDWSDIAFGNDVPRDAVGGRMRR